MPEAGFKPADYSQAEEDLYSPGGSEIGFKNYDHPSVKKFGFRNLT